MGIPGMINRLLIPIVVLAALAGISFAYFIALMLYKPVQRQLDERERMLADQIILQLFQDSAGDFQDKEPILIKAGFPLHCELYCIILLQIHAESDDSTDSTDNADAAGSTHNANNPAPPVDCEEAENTKYYDTLTEIVIDELSSAGYETWLFRDGDSLICVAGLTGMPGWDLTECFEKIRHKLWQLIPGLSLAAAISDVHRSLSEFDLAYAEASMVIIEDNHIGQYNSLLQGGAMSCNQFLQIIVRLSSRLQSNEFCEATKVLGQLKGLFSKRLHRSFSLSRQQLLFIIIDSCLLSLSGNESVPKDVVIRLTAKLNANNRQAAPEKILEVLAQAFDQLQTDTDPQRIIAREIAAYVDTRFTESQLSSASVAAAFGISASKLSILFKREFNKGFLDYLHNLRIEKAIELLKFTDNSTASIMQMVGYTSRDTMTRAFKRYKGVTPKWYRGEGK
jgi:AraC-like DNA-binding protein